MEGTEGERNRKDEGKIINEWRKEGMERERGRVCTKHMYMCTCVHERIEEER